MKRQVYIRDEENTARERAKLVPAEEGVLCSQRDVNPAPRGLVDDRSKIPAEHERTPSITSWRNKTLFCLRPLSPVELGILAPLPATAPHPKRGRTNPWHHNTRWRINTY